MVIAELWCVYWRRTYCIHLRVFISCTFPRLLQLTSTEVVAHDTVALVICNEARVRASTPVLHYSERRPAGGRTGH